MATAAFHRRDEQDAPIVDGGLGFRHEGVEGHDLAGQFVDAHRRRQRAAVTPLERGALGRCRIRRTLGAGEHQQQALRFGLAGGGSKEVVERLHRGGHGACGWPAV